QVPFAALGLVVWPVVTAQIWPFVPIQAQPLQRFEHLVSGLWLIPLGVGIVDAQNQVAAHVARQFPIKVRGLQGANARLPGRAGRKAKARNVRIAVHLTNRDWGCGQKSCARPSFATLWSR